MYKLYNVTDKKSKILGLWRDKKSGKVYRDKIELKEFYTRFDLSQGISESFANNEKAVFYTENGKLAFCDYANGKRDFYRTRKICVSENKLSVKLIKTLLIVYGGLTVFDNSVHGVYKHFLIEIWEK